MAREDKVEKCAVGGFKIRVAASYRRFPMSLRIVVFGMRKSLPPMQMSCEMFALRTYPRYNGPLHSSQFVPVIKKGNMASRTAWHFAYGSTMNRAQMQSRAGNILEERKAHLPNYQLRFNKKVRGGTAGANVQPEPGKTVYGVLYKIEEGAFRSLDRFEGVPEHYRRIEMRVTPDGGEPVSAQVYIASKVEKGLRPAAHYLQSILEGAGEHSLPDSYIGEIKLAAGTA